MIRRFWPFFDIEEVVTRLSWEYRSLQLRRCSLIRTALIDMNKARVGGPSVVKMIVKSVECGM